MAHAWTLTFTLSLRTSKTAGIPTAIQWQIGSLTVEISITFSPVAVYWRLYVLDLSLTSFTPQENSAFCTCIAHFFTMSAHIEHILRAHWKQLYCLSKPSATKYTTGIKLNVIWNFGTNFLAYQFFFFFPQNKIMLIQAFSALIHKICKCFNA